MGQTETMTLSPRSDGSHYGATGDVSCPANPQESSDEKHMAGKEGCHNKGYQADEEHLKWISEKKCKRMWSPRDGMLQQCEE